MVKRLGSTSPDDYVNASYVQPLGTNKRYIATQGPLQATFDDFWTWVLFHLPLDVIKLSLPI